MAETLHEMAVRATKGYCTKACKGCPAKAHESKDHRCLVQWMRIIDNCEEQIEGLRAWAAEHPVPRYPTWREWQESVFPDFSRRIDPCVFMDFTELKCGENLTCQACQERPIPADIAAKLGIKPVTADCSNCKYTDKYEYEEPCVRCRQTQAEGSARWAEMPDLWEEG